MKKLYTSGWSDYELIDAGGGKKLERWGKIITIRPELQAYFKSEKPFDKWNQMAHWEFIPKGAQSGNWKALKKDAPSEWSISYKDLSFNIQLTKFKHVGLFPEQSINWDFIKERLNKDSKFLNLFAYTGAASLSAKNAGAETLHIDSVKQLISWAKENMVSSQLENIKWVHEDALKFAAREVKRGNSYDGIVMDPPAWGIGAKNEKWKLEDKLDELMSNAKALIGKKGFLILNTYSPKVDLETMERLAHRYFSHREFEVSELWMKTTTGKDLFYGNLLRVS
jgi:23S rRNA (cytosine1962-C5)-methyltransferase